MRTKLVLVVFLCVCLGIFTTCSNDEEETTEQSLAEAPSAATWLVIQDQILSQRCVSCHQDGTSEARQSELILTPDVAYDLNWFCLFVIINGGFACIDSHGG